MSDTTVSLLTAPGTGAIATVSVRGSRAWETARKLFTPSGKPLPDVPELNRFWFGTLGQDEVILAVLALGEIEVHCHGGQRVVQWILRQFLAHGCTESPRTPPVPRGFELLQRAPTLHTANIILDQINGAFAREVQRLLTLLEREPAKATESLEAFAARGHSVGRYVVEPWRVVIAGEPNVGKSSLINTLAGFQRSVVSTVAGTTRDTVSVRTAFGGWPVELIDTAGLRDATGLEAEGIVLARDALRTANQLVWVIDASETRDDGFAFDARFLTDNHAIVVANKCDLQQPSALTAIPQYLAKSVPLFAVSAKTGIGIAEFTQSLVAHFPVLPPGTGVPITPEQIQLVAIAAELAQQAKWREASDFLQAAMASVV